MTGRPESSINHASRPGDGSAPVTPDDDVDLPQRARALYVEGEGAVAFIAIDGTQDIWNVPANFIIPITVVRVLATGTDATGIHAIY